MLADFARHTDVDVLMLAGRYTLLDQSALDDLLPACTERGVGIVAAGVFNSGLLARETPSSSAHYDYAAAPAALVDKAMRIATVCERHGTTLPAAALAFPLLHPAIVSVCIGAQSADQITRNAELCSQRIPRSLWDSLREEGLLRPDAPTSSIDPGVRPLPVGSEHGRTYDV
jgi:D-threo-aldose 1-dehydrogenase